MKLIAEREEAAAVFRDLEMKQVLAAEAKSRVARNVKALLDVGLAKYLQLNDRQSAQLEQLLTEKNTVFWDQLLLPMDWRQLFNESIECV